MEWFNPLEWVAWVYGKFFQSHVVVGGTLTALIFAALGVMLWIRGVDKFKEEHSSPKSEAVTASRSIPITQVVTAPAANGNTERRQEKPKREAKAPRKPGSVNQESSGANSPNISNSGTITQGPGSIAQVGNQNTASIVNIPAPKRTLSEAQKQGFANMLASLPSGVRIFISCVGDPEASQYGYQFFSLMTPDHGSGWGTSVVPANPADKGLWFQINQADEPLAREIIGRLRSSGINVDTNVAINPQLKQGQFELVVGLPE